MIKYVVLFKKTENGYSAYVPDIPECTVSSDTLEKTEDLIYEMIQNYIQGLTKENKSIPPAVTESEIMIFVD